MNDTLASVGLWMRMLVFFWVVMIGIALPGGAALGLIITAPADFVIVKENLPAMSKIFVARDNPNTEFCVIELPSAQEAKAKVEQVFEKTNKKTGLITMGQNSVVAQYQKQDGGEFSKLMSVDNYVIDVEAKEEKELAIAYQNLNFLKENPNKSFLLEFFKKDWRVTAGIIAGYYVIFLFALWPVASWVASVGGKKGVKLEAQALTDRLLELNQLDLPFQVVQGKNGVLAAEWKHGDAKWAGVMQANGVKAVDRLLLRVDPESQTVRAVVDTRTVSWTEGSGKTAFMPKLFKGINFFQFNRGSLLGLSYGEGAWKPTSAYSYKFNLNELRSPVIQAITDGGWTFKPVITFIRLIGG